jgi:hypothetical protein
LDDDLLDVPMLALQGGDAREVGEPLLPALAQPYEQACVSWV